LGRAGRYLHCLFGPSCHGLPSPQEIGGSSSHSGSILHLMARRVLSLDEIPSRQGFRFAG
jgi:hypothetical protein